MEFIKKSELKVNGQIETIKAETENAILVDCVRHTGETMQIIDWEKVRGFSPFEDELWVPKSAIVDGTVKSWFMKKNKIVRFL